MQVKIKKTTAYAAGALLLAGGLAVATGVIHKPTRKTRPLGFSSFGTNSGISRAFDVNPIVPSFSYNLAGSKPLAKGPGGTEVIASADNTPILIVPQSEILNRWAISVGILRLEVGGLREPHWHPNCSEIGYIAGGTGVMTIFSGAPASFRQSFTLETGTVFYVPNGLFHHIENIGNMPMTVLAAWNNERPQTIGLSGFLGAAPKDIVERSMGMRGSNFFNGFNNNSGIDIVIGRKTQSAGPSVVSGISQQVPGMSDSGIVTTKVDQVSTQSPFKYPIEMAQPGAKTQAGMTIMADSPHFPALKGQGQACFSITLKAGGGREPHWHQHAGELHFVHFGNTRYFVQAPGGQSELANLGAGEFFYAPPGYSHMFENIGGSDLHVVSFFTDDNPGDIGLTGGMSSYTNAVLGATFMKDPNLFNMMKRYDQDQAIVGSPGSVIRARQMGQQQGVSTPAGMGAFGFGSESSSG